MSRRAMAAAAALVTVLIGAVVVVAVVADSGDEAPSRPAAPSGAPQFAAPSADLQECLEEQGAELPGGPPEPGAEPPQDQLEAMKECSEYLPGPTGAGPPGIEIPAG